MNKIFFDKVVSSFFQNRFKKKYRFRNVDDIPKKIDDNTIYIVQEGTEPETLVFMCPCGCQQPVLLNLLKDTHPFWTFQIEKRKISLFPSVIRKKGCHSHYCIKNGTVIWVRSCAV